MRHSRASALLAALAVMLSTIVGITLTPSAASARPAVHYPPPPPSLVVNHGVVHRGGSVRATGHTFQARERVRIVVRFWPKASNRFRTLRSDTAYADRRGDFRFTVRTSSAGYIVITATGQISRKSASASVFVVDRRRFGRAAAMKPVAFKGSDPSIAAPRVAAPAGNVNGVAMVGVAVMVLAGCALIAQRAVRRRRKGAVTEA